MKSVRIRGSVVVAVAIIFVLGHGVATPAHAQQSALAANPELAAKGVWNATTNYLKEDIVSARGSAWIAKRNNKGKMPGQTAPTSTAADWQLFARGFNPLGAWSSAITYQPDDLVTFNGQTFRAKLTKSNSQPAANAFWELLVTKGAAGATGATGPAGPNTGIGNGSTSAPSISFTGDPDTGIYHPEANRIALVEGGTLFLHNLGANNAALGLGALSAGSTGVNNVAVGGSALGFNTSGGNNTALGNLAMFSNTTGVNNTAAGQSALGLNETGSANTALGVEALGNSTVSDNTAIGYQAMTANTTGTPNTAVGKSALASNTSGAFNTAVGTGALQSNTTTSANTALGHGALSANIDGSNNTAVGAAALASNLGGIYNAALGVNALLNNTASFNTALGTSALTSNVGGEGNTAVGYSALQNNTSGGANIAVGDLALQINTTGIGNIALGASAGKNATNPSESIFIGNPGLSGDDFTIKIGTPTVQQSTFIAGIVEGTSIGDAPVFIDTATGQLGLGAPSSRTKKDDIETMADVTAMLGKLRPVTFRYKKPAHDGSRPLQYGLIAEEVAQVMPYLAAYSPDGTIRSVHYDRLPPFLLAGWQAQQNTIDAQADELRQQKEVNASLKARLARLEALLPQTKAAALQ